MNKRRSFLFCAALTLCLTAANLTAAKPPTPTPTLATVNLGSAARFAVLGGSTVTNVAHTVITGDLGVYPGTSVTGFPPGVVNGKIDAGSANGPASFAQSSLTTAFDYVAGLPGGTKVTDLTSKTLVPGLYYSPTTKMLIGPGGILYLNGKGVYIFQMGKGGSGGTSLTVDSTASIVLQGGAQAADIFWVVGTKATFGTGTKWAGTIMAGKEITHAGGNTLDGRALGKTGVTFDGDGSTVTIPIVVKSPRK